MGKNTRIAFPVRDCSRFEFQLKDIKAKPAAFVEGFVAEK
jgi:hypothetical protein